MYRHFRVLNRRLKHIAVSLNGMRIAEFMRGLRTNPPSAMSINSIVPALSAARST